MALIVEGGSLTFDAMSYAMPHPNTLQFLSSQFEQATSNLTAAGQRFLDTAKDMYDRLSSSEALNRFRVAGRAIRSMWQMDEIRQLNTIGEFQNAPLSMQRWIMAEPTGRKMYHQQRMDGYSETYLDMEPSAIGEEHYDYRRVMDGLLVMDEEEDLNGDLGWTATTYWEELLPEDNDLSLEEQVDITNSWKFFKEHLKAGKEDPTSRFNSDLG